jgi:hypothetical protein
VSVVNISERETLIDVDDQLTEFHLASLCIKQVSNFKIRYTPVTEKTTSPTIIELLLASEEIHDKGSGTYFNSVKLFDVKTKKSTKWNVNRISNQLPKPTTEWHFEHTGVIRSEMEFKFNLAMISKNRPEGGFEFQVDGAEWKEISKPSQSSTERLISSARQEWVQDQLDLILGQDITSNPFFHPKQEATSGAIRAHVEPNIRHITYVGLDDAANFFSSIYGLYKKGVELENLNVSLRYAKEYDVNSESTWLEKHPRVERTKIQSSIHTEPWANTDLIIDTYTIGEWFHEATNEQYQDRFEQEIRCRQKALETNGKIILVYPTKPTPLCSAPEPSVLQFFDDQILMKNLGLKVIEKITKVGAAEGYILQKIESDKDMLSNSPPTQLIEAESLTATSEDLQVVSDFTALREVIDRRSRSIMYHMEKNHPMMEELVRVLTKKLYQHEGPKVIVVAGPPGIRKTTMVASALLPNEIWQEWSGKKQPSILVGTPKAAWNRRAMTNSEERRILFLDDLQDQLEDIREIYLQETGSQASDLESTLYFLKNLTGYAAVIVTWKSTKEEDDDYFDNAAHIHCIDMQIYNDVPTHNGSATNQANQYIKQHFDGDWVEVLRQRDPKRFEDWLAEIKQCLILILTDPKYRGLQSYVGCNDLKEKLRISVKKIRRQSVKLDPFVDSKLELDLLLEESIKDPFDKKVVN